MVQDNPFPHKTSAFGDDYDSRMRPAAAMVSFSTGANSNQLETIPVSSNPVVTSSTSFTAWTADFSATPNNPPSATVSTGSGAMSFDTSQMKAALEEPTSTESQSLTTESSANDAVMNSTNNIIPSSTQPAKDKAKLDEPSSISQSSIESEKING